MTLTLEDRVHVLEKVMSELLDRNFKQLNLFDNTFPENIRITPQETNVHFSHQFATIQEKKIFEEKLAMAEMLPEECSPNHIDKLKILSEHNLIREVAEDRIRIHRMTPSGQYRFKRDDIINWLHLTKGKYGHKNRV